MQSYDWLNTQVVEMHGDDTIPSVFNGIRCGLIETNAEFALSKKQHETY